MERDWRAEFETVYASKESRTAARILGDVMGMEYPAELDPHSYLSRTELRRFAAELRIGRGQVLVDIGCGRGGAGLWVAAETGADLIGLDIAEAPLVDARQRATCLGVRASFERGEFERTGLANASVDAVMSVDALLFAPDKAAAFGELRRVLRSGGRLALTSWDYWRQPAGRPPQVQDHRPIAQAAGFTILTYEETPGWRDILERTGVAMLAAAAELAAESGEPVEVVRSLLIEENATIDAMSRRIFLVAEATE